jgi:hypothetical protein
MSRLSRAGVDLGYEIFPRERQTPEALGALVKADAEKWWPIIKELGIQGGVSCGGDRTGDEITPDEVERIAI